MVMDIVRAYKTPSAFAREFLFFSDGMGHQKTGDFYLDRANFKNNLIMFVVEGTLYVEQNGKRVLKKGDGIIMRLTEHHIYYSDPVDVCELLWLHFAGKECEPFLQLIEKTCGLPAVFRLPDIEDMIRGCFPIINSGNPREEILLSKAIYAALLDITHYLCDESNDPDPQTQFRDRAELYINQHIYDDITLAGLAAHFNLSTYHFCRLFRRYFEATPMQYVLAKKIEMSKYLLYYTDQSMAAIANSLGFTDQSHFSKTFRKLEGMSPTTFRKMDP